MLQDEAPPSEKLPGPHCKHDDKSVAPVPALYVPLGHAVNIALGQLYKINEKI